MTAKHEYCWIVVRAHFHHTSRAVTSLNILLTFTFPLHCHAPTQILHIVTRWKKDEAGMLIDRSGKKLLEFVAFKRHGEDNKWSIPSLQVADDVLKWKAKLLKDKQTVFYNKQDKNGTPFSDDAFSDDGQTVEKGKTQIEKVELAKKELKELEAHNKRPDTSTVIANQFNIGYSAAAHHAFHAKNFKTTIADPQKKWVKDNVEKMFDATRHDSKESQNSKPFQGKMIYEGFMDDERSFGGAYSFVSVFIHHDEDELLGAYNLTTTATDPAEEQEFRKAASHCIHGMCPDAISTIKPQCEDFYEMSETHKDYSPICKKQKHRTACDIKKSPAPAEAAWLTVHRDLDLCGEEEDLLRHVADLHQAYW
jgi:hypothetical protein